MPAERVPMQLERKLGLRVRKSTLERGTHPLHPSPESHVLACSFVFPQKLAFTQATTLRISSIEVSPICAFRQPSDRNGIIPCACAVLLISAAEARSTANLSISSETDITSCTAIRPRYPVPEHVWQPTGRNKVGIGCVGSKPTRNEVSSAGFGW